MKHTIYILLLNLILINQSDAQCFDADASIWLDTWASCETSSNPISAYGNTHWIQYDFGAVRKLSKTWVWNANDPTKLDQGFNLVKIDYSSDGQQWTNWGEMNFPKAAGNAVYGGFSGPDLMGIEAQYVLVTAMSNHGNASCAGIAEFKFNLLPDGSTGTPPPPGGGGGDCAQVEEIFVEEVTAYEAILFWEYETDEEEVIFIVQYQEEDGDIIEIETEEPEAFLEGLSPDTFYDFRIGVECDDEIIWSEIGSFVTEPEETECFAVEEVVVEEVFAYEAFLFWEYETDEDEVFFLFKYKEVGQSWMDIETEEPEVFLEDLEPNTKYKFKVAVECDGEFLWSPTGSFTTPDEEDEEFDFKDTPALASQNVMNYKVFPNPSKGQITFQISSESEDVLDYSIVDVHGKIVLRNQMNLSKGLNQATLELSNLPDGIYMLHGVSEWNRSLIQDKIVKISN